MNRLASQFAGPEIEIVIARVTANLDQRSLSLTGNNRAGRAAVVSETVGVEGDWVSVVENHFGIGEDFPHLFHLFLNLVNRRHLSFPLCELLSDGLTIYILSSVVKRSWNKSGKNSRDFFSPYQTGERSLAGTGRGCPIHTLSFRSPN